MDSNRNKKAAEWFYRNVFQDEAIRPRPGQKAERLPSMLRAARSLEKGPNTGWHVRESIFLKQAKLLTSYEDDYDYRGNVVRYFPTYQSLTDQELRGYFSWRTKLRRGNVVKAPLTFAFLYIYELLNQIGVSDSMEGYRSLKEFGRVYGSLDEGILSYLNTWLTDYVIYYGLDPNLLADSRQVELDRCITILDHVQEQDIPKVMYAVKTLSPRWLERSRFYSTHQEDMDAVIVRVLRRVSAHYASKCKRTMVESYFGMKSQYQVRLFESAVFLDQSRQRTCEYAVDEQCIYRCKNGLWTVEKYNLPQRPNPKLAELMKTIDAVMREEYGYGHPIQYETEVKWLLKLIREEIRSLLEEKKAEEAQKITIDYGALAKIRRDAAITRDRLVVDEELEEEPVSAPEPEPQLPPEPQPEPEHVTAVTAPDCPLEEAEYRLLQCLLYGRDLSWVHQEGHILSVLSDSINDKLYDRFLDSVLDDSPALIEDYIDELKEMVAP